MNTEAARARGTTDRQSVEARAEVSCKAIRKRVRQYASGKFGAPVASWT
jgi:hypothetical protein